MIEWSLPVISILDIKKAKLESSLYRIAVDKQQSLSRSDRYFPYHYVF